MTDEEVIERVEELESRMEEVERKLSKSGKQVIRTEENSVYEYSKKFDAGTHRKKIIVIGNFLEHEEGQEGFTVKDIKEAYRRCKWSAPANPSDIIGKMRNDDLLIELGETEEGKEYVLEQKAEQKVEELREDE